MFQSSMRRIFNLIVPAAVAFTAPTTATVLTLDTTTKGSSFPASSCNFIPANGLQGLYYNWVGSRLVRLGLEVSELREFCELLAHLWLTNTPNVWEYTTDFSRVFSVKGMRSHITNSSLHESTDPFEGPRYFHRKSMLNTWRIIHRRVRTRSNLDIRGVDLDSVYCTIYDDEIESVEHIFVMCNVAREAWKNILLW
ncbi:RNA-directed DNA polymerase, eukaryota, reverse transcriptase zinc-binding domain protein [Tanacetum coccineum]